MSKITVTTIAGLTSGGDANNNGLAAGPLTIASGVTLTINGELSVV